MHTLSSLHRISVCRIGILLLLGMGTPWWTASANLRAAEATVKVVNKPLPAGLAESFRTLLQPQATQLLEGDAPLLEFWFPASWNLGKAYDAPSKGLGSLSDTAVLGAVVVHKDMRDYRDDELFPGTYTMRLGLRPNDGNHLGTSEFLYFAVLTPAKLDPSVEAIKTYKQLVKASRQESATDHPFILSLRPGTSDSGEFPRLNKPADAHKSLLLNLPASFEGQMSNVFVDLVYEGVAQH